MSKSLLCCSSGAGNVSSIIHSPSSPLVQVFATEFPVVYISSLVAAWSPFSSYPGVLLPSRITWLLLPNKSLHEVKAEADPPSSVLTGLYPQAAPTSGFHMMFEDIHCVGKSFRLPSDDQLVASSRCSCSKVYNNSAQIYQGYFRPHSTEN